MATRLKYEFKIRETLIIVLFFYLPFILFTIDNEVIRDLKDYIIRDTFHLENVSSSNFRVTGSGGQTGTNWTYHIKCGDGIERTVIKGYFFKRYDQNLFILVSNLRRDYVYNFPKNSNLIYNIKTFWTITLYVIIFKCIVLILGIFLIYLLLKQHKIVKTLAPYGVDENYEPLPKPTEKFNFNKYDK
jgi:hypothetical protein